MADRVIRAYQPPPRIPKVSAGSTRCGEGAIAADREPAELDREHVEQEDSDHELRRRDRRERGDHQDPVDRTAAVGRGDDPGAQADEQLDDDGAGHELQGRRQARQDQRRDLRLLDVGAAEIALQQIAEIAQVLLPQGQVEAELAPDALDHRGRGVAARELTHRVGRKEVEQEIGHQRDADEDEQRLAEAAGEVMAHQSRPRWVGSSASRSASPRRLNARASSRIAAPGMNTSHGAVANQVWFS